MGIVRLLLAWPFGALGRVRVIWSMRYPDFKMKITVFVPLHHDWGSVRFSGKGKGVDDGISLRIPGGEQVCGNHAPYDIGVTVLDSVERPHAHLGAIVNTLIGTKLTLYPVQGVVLEDEALPPSKYF